MNKKESMIEILFYFSYVLILFSNYFQNIVFLQNILEPIKIIAIIILLFICFTQSNIYYKSTILAIFLLVIINLYVYVKTDNSLMLLLFLLIFASKNIDSEELIKKDIKIKIIIVIFVFLMFIMGFTTNQEFFREGVRRYAFGFVHPNTFAAIISSILIEIIYINRNKKNILLLFISIIVAFISNYYADSRTSIIVILLVCMAYLFQNSILEKFLNRKGTKFIIINSWLIFTIISFIIAFLYKEQTGIGIFLDKMLSTRPRWMVRFLNTYNINLFGNKMIFVNETQAVLLNVSKAILDNAYVKYLLQYGIVLYTVMYYLFRKLFKYAYKNKNIMLIIIEFILLFRGVSESGCYFIYSNIFLIFFSDVIYQKERI